MKKITIVDGSVTGTTLSNLANYQDTDYTHEHTYFGNGNGPSGSLTTVGTTYQTTTYDGEAQKIGTYYNFQAATIGTGAALTDDGEQAPDSFCPNGWQLAIGGNQNTNKAFKALLSSYSIANNNTGSIAGRSYPLSYLLSGNYYWYYGRLSHLGSYGNWWSNTIEGGGRAYYLTIGEDGIYADDNYGMDLGFPLRCVSTYLCTFGTNLYWYYLFTIIL